MATGRGHATCTLCLGCHLVNAAANHRPACQATSRPVEPVGPGRGGPSVAHAASMVSGHKACTSATARKLVNHFMLSFCSIGSFLRSSFLRDRFGSRAQHCTSSNPRGVPSSVKAMVSCISNPTALSLLVLIGPTPSGAWAV